LGAAAVLEAGAGLSILSGYRARLGSALLFTYLVPTTLIFHDFWNQHGEDREMQFMNFTKNLAVLGGLAILANHGGGNLSLGRGLEEKRLVPERLIPRRFQRAA
jgi:putative oxidoreductase